MALEWGKRAWNEVLPDTIVKCFKKIKLYPQEMEEEDDKFEGENELPAVEELYDNVGSSWDAGAFISAEESIDV